MRKNKMLALLLAMVMLLGSVTTAFATVGNYTDVKDAWYTEYVQYVTENKLMDGVTADTFEPGTNADRATVVVALYRLAGSPEVTGENPFTDVAEDASYRDAIVWAKENSVTNGTSDTTFGPTNHITRQDLVTLIWRYTKNSGKDVSVGEDTNILSFDDAASVKDYAVEAFQWACGTGVITGSGSNLLPRDNTTRAQLAAIIQRYAGLTFEKAEDTEKPEETETTGSDAILDAAYALKDGQTMNSNVTLTGIITEIDTPWSDQYSNISVVIVVDGDTERPLLCYRLKGEGAKELIVGDTVTVTGKIKNYQGIIEFDAGCNLDKVEKTGVPTEAPEVDTTSVESILKAAYALKNGEKLGETVTLTGVIKKIDTEWSNQYKNITVTIEIEGFADMPIMCYRLKGDGAKDLKIGDTITVTGVIKNYKGTIEFDAGCTLVSVTKA